MTQAMDNIQSPVSSVSLILHNGLDCEEKWSGTLAGLFNRQVLFCYTSLDLDVIERSTSFVRQCRLNHRNKYMRRSITPVG